MDLLGGRNEEMVPSPIWLSNPSRTVSGSSPALTTQLITVESIRVNACKASLWEQHGILCNVISC